MTNLIEYTSTDAAPSSPSRRDAPVALPFLLAIGRGFTLAGWGAIILVSGIFGATVHWGLGRVLDFSLMALAGFLFVFLFEGLAVLLWKLLNAILSRAHLDTLNGYIQAIPAAIAGRFVGIGLIVFGDVLWPESIFQHVTIALPGKFIVMAAAVGGGFIFAARLVKRPFARWAVAALGLLPLLAVILWLAWPGTDAYLAQASPVEPQVPAPVMPNPALPGPYAVATLSYGSGGRRPEFAEGATLTTRPVDGSPLFAGYSGLIGDYFRWYNGFDLTAAPLNGLVWYPQGEGPFPLVLIVHGNHNMTEPSDPGYAYLAEHLASRGMIAVSVDENYLNGFNLTDPDMAEMPLRAWLLLKHLEQWRDWNAAPGNPFYGRVDMERVGLIGHSRGGEAVAHAAEMNARPIDAAAAVSKGGDFGFGIRGVVALAPCDNRYRPAGRPLHLKNADYLLLASGHDGDMYYLDGLGQYARATFAENPDGFKALAYLYRGNHGNFNSVWGDNDKGWFNSLLLNRKPLLTVEEQQQAALVFITGFLEVSLNGRDEYRALFYDLPAARAWLPTGVIVTQYMDADFIQVDANTTGSREELDVPGGSAEVRDMTAWRNAGRLLRDGVTTVPNRGMLLEWAAGGDPAYILNLPEGMAAERGLSLDHALSFTLAHMAESGTIGRIWVELEAKGVVVRLPLDQFGPMPPLLPAQLVKADWIAEMPSYEIDTTTPYERVDQTYDLPLAAFAAADPDFQPESLSIVRFLFDGAADGRIMVDEIGFRTP